MAGGVPYLLQVTLGLASRDRRFVLGVALASSALTVVGMVLAPTGSGPADCVLPNRGLALIAIGVTALGVRSQVALNARLEQAHRDLMHRESLARLGESDVRERLAGLPPTVEDLMASARPSRLLSEPCDLKNLLRETRALIESDGQWPDLEIQLQGPDITTLTDRQQLRCAVLDVVLNAAAAQAGHGAVLAQVEQVGDPVPIGVSDQGPDEPHHLRDRIFEPFFTTRTQGTGLACRSWRRPCGPTAAP
jgi:signal transduction histidine kinase